MCDLASVCEHVLYLTAIVGDKRDVVERLVKIVSARLGCYACVEKKLSRKV